MLNIFKSINIRIEKSKEVIKTYNKERTKEKKNKDTKKMVRAVDKLAYELIKIWDLHIIIPVLSVIVLLLYILKLFAVQILAVGVLVYGTYDHFKKPKVDRRNLYHNGNYLWLQEHLYEIFKIIEDYLPIRRILNPYDLVNFRKFQQEKGVVFYLFNVMKTTSEELEKEKIDFAKRIFEAELIKRMDEHEEIHNDWCTYFKGERVLVLDKIRDFGTHYEFRILKIDSIEAYNYFISKKNTSGGKKYTNRKDGDF
ncbi:MAG TPA: hypothetical protein VJ962_06055 [Clostridia bacterium]|nr:hypothetical protein [Clostridia bacterium]